MSTAERHVPVASEDPRLRRLVLAAWILPALLVAATTASRAILEPGGLAAGEVLRGIGAAAWIILASLPSSRPALLEIGLVVLGKLRFVPLLLATAVVLLLGLSKPAGSLWHAAAVGLLCLTLAAARLDATRDRRKFLFTLILVALNLLLLIPVDWFVGAYVLPRKSHNNVFIEHDSLLGWKLRRGISITRQEERYASTETVNALGFRTPRLPTDKPAGMRRILFLGDSHTEAYTVNDDEMYPVLVEAALAGRAAVEVVSIGVGGFSTDQELLAYLHFGRAYRPDVVVLQFTSNDVRFNVLDRYWRGRKPRFHRYGDVLLLSGVPVPNLRDTGLFGPDLLQRSSLVLLVETVLRQLAVKRSVELEADPEEAWRVTALLLRDLDQIVRSDGAQFLVFLADRHPETGTRLREILQGLAIPFIETDDVYTDPFDSYWVDGHWNQKGHRVIADRLAGALRPYLR